MSEENKTETCPLCREQHESMTLFGVKFIPCPMMPKDTIMPSTTIEAFFQGRPVLDQPLIVIT